LGRRLGRAGGENLTPPPLPSRLPKAHAPAPTLVPPAPTPALCIISD
jgi:hypothetical protein